MLIHELVHKTDLQDVLFHAGQLSSFAKRNLVSVFKRIRSLQTIRTGAVILPTDKDDLTTLSLEEFAGASVPDDILEKEGGACILASLIQAWTREYNLRKRAQYYTARKKRHQQDHLARKAEKAAGQTHFRKLAFFDSIMKKAGYDRVSFAKAAHTTVQNLSYHFVRDNANLSTIQSMLKNEKYMGDLLLQKSYTKDFLTKEVLTLDSRLELRGMGLIWGIDFGKIDASLADKIIEKCFERRLICECAGREGAVLKIMPPLVIEDDLLKEGLQIIAEAAKETLASL